MKTHVCTIIMLLILVSCRGEQMQRSSAPVFGFTKKITRSEENTLAYQMETALLIDDDDERYKRVETLLKAGADPNKKTGQFKWLDTNPLWDCCGDEKLVSLFISYGADKNKRPYIAKILKGHRIITREEQIREWENFPCIVEDDILSVLQLLLESGADPNLKAYGSSIVLWPATDWNYRRYFNKYGDTAINQAIKYNAFKITKLLIAYDAKLDDKSFAAAKKATELSGSTEMEELVKAQWIRQNGS